MSPPNESQCYTMTRYQYSLADHKYIPSAIPFPIIMTPDYKSYSVTTTHWDEL